MSIVLKKIVRQEFLRLVNDELSDLHISQFSERNFSNNVAV